MTTAIYAGSFDPLTLGHLDILKRSSKIFKKIIITVAYNSTKQGFLSVEERIKLINECTKDFGNVEVCSSDILTTEFAKQKKATVLIRGLRDSSDFEYEEKLAQTNFVLDSNIQTVFLISKPQYSHISSSCVKELVLYKQKLEEFVPSTVAEYLYKKFW